MKRPMWVPFSKSPKSTWTKGHSQPTPWWTHANQYGDFTDNWKRIPLTQLPARQRADGIERMRHNILTSSSEYGGFYDSQNHDYPYDYLTNSSYLHLPPLSSQQLHPVDYGRFDEISRDPWNIHLPDIRDIDIEMTTKNLELLHINPAGTGFRYKTDPPELDHVTLPDIRDVNITITRKDGSVITIPTRSKLAVW